MVTGKKDFRWVLTRIMMYIVMIFTVAVSIFPIIWVVISSFKTNAEILGGALTVPSGFSVGAEAYRYLFEQYNFLLYFFNSLLISTISTAVSLLFYAMGGYVLAKFRFPGRGILFALFTITMLVPGHSKAQPIMQLIVNFNLYDTKTSVTLVYLSSGMAMSMFLLRGTFLSIPKELDESAMLDGAGFFRTFWSINFPLAKSGLATAGILMFLGNWNEYFYAALLTSSEQNRTLPVALQFFNQSFSYDYTKMFAALTIVVLPGILLYMCAQEQVQQSVATSGMKN